MIKLSLKVVWGRVALIGVSYIGGDLGIGFGVGLGRIYSC